MKKNYSPSTKRRSSAQKSGFKKNVILFDKGYRKSTKDGGSLHKYGPNSKIHKDKIDPYRNPVGHVVNDVIVKKIKRILQ